MIIGSINAIGSKLALDLKAIDVSTSKIVGVYNDLFKSIDGIVNNINEVAGQFTQNITGKMAKQREVLKYEKLVPLIVKCEVEGAKVSIDGVSVGKVTNGMLSKAVNKDAEILLEVNQDGYYPYRTKIVMDKKKEVLVKLEEKHLAHFGFKAGFGGGQMGSLVTTIFIIPNWWYTDLGMGFTINNTNPVFINLPIILRSGSYLFFDDRKLFRPYIGIQALYTATAVYNKSIMLYPINLFFYHLNFGIHTGMEIKTPWKLRSALEINLFFNEFWQSQLYYIQLGLFLELLQ